MRRENLPFEHFISQALDKRLLYYTIFGMLLIIQLCPIWFTTYPAMHDYPNHLARAHILNQYSDVESYRSTYERTWHLIPNLAIDLIIPGLLNVCSVETASKIFLSLTITLFNLGIHALGLAINGRPRWTVLAATFFTYNFAFSYGFVNYIFGLGVFFIALATWLWMRDAWKWHRVFLMTLLTLACYFSHLSSFVFLAIATGTLTLTNVAKTRVIRWHHVMGLLPLVPTVVMYGVYRSSIEHGPAMEWWHPILLKKAIGLLYPFISHNIIFDSALGLALILLLLVAYFWKAAHVSAKDFVLIGSLFIILYVLAPMSGGEQSSYIDRRFLIPAAVCLMLSFQIDTARKVGRYVMIGLLILSVTRVGGVWKFWTSVSHEIEAQVHVLDRLPDGVRLYPMFIHDKAAVSTWLWDMHFFYSAHYATIYRHAFVPTLYAWDSVNPLHLRTHGAGYAQMERETPADRVDWNQICAGYDYLWGYKLSDELKRHAFMRADLVAQAGEAMLFRIRKG